MRMNALPNPKVMRSKSLLTFLLMLAMIRQFAQVPEYSKQVNKSYPVTQGATIDIANKYGKVQVITWDTDSVKFIIDLRIRAKDESKLQKLKQTIDFEFIPGQHYIVAHTKIGDTGSEVIKEIVDIAGSYLSASNSVIINYTVMVPANNPLKIENKFGDVYLDDLNESLSLNLSYGDLTCNRLNEKSEIRITSGSAEINFIRDGILYLSYGNIHIRDAEKLSAETRSSNVTIDKSASLKINSRRDKLFLNNLITLSGESYFSRINIGVLHNDMNFVSRYGDITLDNIRRGFSLVQISAEYTDVSLGFEKPMLFNMELKHHQDVAFVYPKNLANLKTSVASAENKQFLTSGTFGIGTTEANVVMNLPKRCNLTLSYR
jgi:hypothetical protein